MPATPAPPPPLVTSPTSTRRRAGLLALVAAIVVFTVVSVAVGTRTISPATTWQALTAFDPADSEHLLVVLQRVPRALLSIVVGVALGVAGAIMQALTRNPLAEPGLLGVNAGAAVAIACGISFFGITDVTGYMWLGMIGAAAAATGVYILGGVRRGTNPVRLVLAGSALTVVLMSLTQLVLVNGEEDVYDRYRHWMVGSIAGRGYDVLVTTLIITLLGVVLALSLARPLDSAMLGEDLSRSLGANPTRVWAFAGIAVIILAGAATAAAGPIAFLGLAAPHLARLLIGVNHRWVLPTAGLIGALMMLAADTIGRALPFEKEVSVGIMVAILGGPFFVYLVRRRRVVQL